MSKEMTKEELEKYKKILANEISAFLKECPICKQKFKDFLDIKIICTNCDREEKLNKVLEK
jgi:hypothetical protein